MLLILTASTTLDHLSRFLGSIALKKNTHKKDIWIRHPHRSLQLIKYFWSISQNDLFPNWYSSVALCREKFILISSCLNSKMFSAYSHINSVWTECARVVLAKTTIFLFGLVKRNGQKSWINIYFYVFWQIFTFKICLKNWYVYRGMCLWKKVFLWHDTAAVLSHHGYMFSVMSSVCFLTHLVLCMQTTEIHKGICPKNIQTQ